MKGTNYTQLPRPRPAWPANTWHAKASTVEPGKQGLAGSWV